MASIKPKLIFYLILLLFVSTSCKKQTVLVRINHEYIGCFGHGYNRIVVFEENGLKYARVRIESATEKTVLLTSNQIDTLNIFLKEFENLKEGFGCTTTEIYSIAYKKSVVKKIDRGCSWYGLSNLSECFLRGKK